MEDRIEIYQKLNSESDIIKSLISAVDQDSYGDFSISSAPGRVNLIGEHTDYNEGFVLPCAINLRTFCVARKRKDKNIRIVSLNLNKVHIQDIDDIKPSYNWWSYVLGCSYVLGIRQGFNIAIYGTVPLGGGLSSSASLEVSAMYAISNLFGLRLDRREIAFLSRRVENEFVGVPCGIMDQLCSSLGVKQNALFIDCRTYEVQNVKFPEDWKIVVCDSGVKHELGSSEYAKRQDECKKVVEIAKRFDQRIKSLRDISTQTLEKIKYNLDPVLYRRAKFIVEENQRVIEAVEAISKKDKGKVFELFSKSHIGLSKEYEVSCEELDILFDIAKSFEGIVGTRMTGGGFGGNTVNIVESGREMEFIDFISNRYMSVTGRKPISRLVQIDSGVQEHKI